MSEGLKTMFERLKAETRFPAPEDFVFCDKDGNPLSPDHLRRQVLYPALEAAGVTIGNRTHGLHMFRHTAITVVAQRAGLLAAKEQAGHRDIALTAKVYVHSDAESRIERAEVLHSFLREDAR
jgi:integrase